MILSELCLQISDGRRSSPSTSWLELEGFESQVVVSGGSIKLTLRIRRESTRRFHSVRLAQFSDAASERPQSGDHLGMRDRAAPLENPRTDATVVEAPDETRWYDNAIAEFGSSLARLAAAYEFDRAQQQDLLQVCQPRFALWRLSAQVRADWPAYRSTGSSDFSSSAATWKSS
jgi:hypothetical protein